MKRFYQSYLKRPFDLILSAVALLFLMPLLLLVAVLIKIESRGPVFYRQSRVGRGGRVFTILKLRSMTHRPNRIPGEQGEIIGENAEVTRVGRLIRRAKLDEMPQLISVFLGDMSLIGPRPCLPELVESFDENGRKRLAVRPGCSGLAQVHGNIHLSWNERWEYDAYYAENVSFLLDFEIGLKTLGVMLKGEERFVMPFRVFAETRRGRNV